MKHDDERKADDPRWLHWLGSWRRERPTKVGLFWWWNGNPESSPVFCHVMPCGDGINLYQWVPSWQGWSALQQGDKLRGYWQELNHPKRQLPSK